MNFGISRTLLDSRRVINVNFDCVSNTMIFFLSSISHSRYTSLYGMEIPLYTENTILYFYIQIRFNLFVEQVR